MFGKLKEWALAALAITSPIHGMFGASVALIVIDMITGMLAARKRGEAITSKRWRDTTAKFLTYNLGILSAFLIETYMVPGIPLVNLVAGVIALHEGKSISENLKEITGVDLLGAVVEKLNKPKE